MPDANAHLLAGLCRELQERAGNKPFFLIGRVAANLIGRAPTTVAWWLRAFRTLRILQLVEQGTQRRGSRYRYIAKD
jgi:hypothetical protein